MEDLPPPGKPTQDKADDASGPSGDQHDTEIQENISVRQILEGQKVGNFDFASDFGVIKNENHFQHMLREYEKMDDELNRVSDFPTDSKTQMTFASRLAKTILNMELAADTKIKDRKPATKSKANASNGEQGSGNVNKAGEKDSVAVTFLNGLKLFEIELACWKLLIFSRDAQEGRLSRGAFGAQKTAIASFDTWTARFTCILKCLEMSKTLARQVIREGNPRIKNFVADPIKELNQVIHNRVNNSKRRDKKDATENLNLPTPAETSDKRPPEALNSPRPLDGGNQQKNVTSSPTSAEKQKQPSPVRQAHSAPQGNAQPANSTTAKAFLAPFGGRKNPTALPAPGPVKRSTKDDHSIPDDADFSDVARPNVHDRDGPATPTETQLPSGPYRFVVPAEFFSTAASPPTSQNAGNEPKSAVSTSIDPQAIAASIEKYRRRRQPRSRVSNESTAESANEEFSPPVLPPRPSSEDDQDPGNPYKLCVPAGGHSALAGSSSSAMQYQTSAAETQLLQGPSGPFSVAEGSSQNDIPATLDTRSPAKKRQRLSPQAEDDPPPHAHGATATESHKRHKRDSSGSSMDGNVDDLGWDYEDDDDDSSMDGNVDDLGWYYEEDDDDEYYDAEQ